MGPSCLGPGDPLKSAPQLGCGTVGGSVCPAQAFILGSESQPSSLRAGAGGGPWAARAPVSGRGGPPAAALRPLLAQAYPDGASRHDLILFPGACAEVQGVVAAPSFSSWASFSLFPAGHRLAGRTLLLRLPAWLRAGSWLRHRVWRARSPVQWPLRARRAGASPHSSPVSTRQHSLGSSRGCLVPASPPAPPDHPSVQSLCLCSHPGTHPCASSCPLFWASIVPQLRELRVCPAGGSAWRGGGL